MERSLSLSKNIEEVLGDSLFRHHLPQDPAVESKPSMASTSENQQAHSIEKDVSQDVSRVNEKEDGYNPGM